MATNLQQIASFLDNRGFPYELQTQKNRIITAVNSETVDKFLIVIEIEEDGEYLSLFIPELLSIKDHVYKGVAFQTMLAIAWEVKLLRWQYDSSDGEVRTSVNLPLEDAPLTEKQFNRLLSDLIRLTERGMERLQQVLATGNDPELQSMRT